MTGANDEGDVWFVCFKINLRGWYIAVPFETSGDYTFENHAVYTGEHGKFIVTSAIEFFQDNRDLILKQTA